MTQKQRDMKRKIAVLEYAERSGNVAKTCSRFARPAAAVPPRHG